MNRPAKVLTIAGSDSGGCAGIQADLRTFAALGIHGSSAVTAVTAQNTVGVDGIQNISPRMIALQIRSVLADIGADAVKSGMIAVPSAIRSVALVLQEFAVEKYVLDPVMVATSGARLMSPGAERALCRHLFPMATLVTPNRYEAEILAGNTIRTRHQAEAAARSIRGLGPGAVLIKGGHFSGDATDLLYDGRDYYLFSSPREKTRNLHGAGCTLAAAIAAFLAQGAALLEAVSCAKAYVAAAVKSSYSVGEGPGPLGHFFQFWKS